MDIAGYWLLQRQLQMLSILSLLQLSRYGLVYLVLALALALDNRLSYCQLQYCRLALYIYIYKYSIVQSSGYSISIAQVIEQLGIQIDTRYLSTLVLLPYSALPVVILQNWRPRQLMLATWSQFQPCYGRLRSGNWDQSSWLQPLGVRFSGNYRQIAVDKEAMGDLAVDMELVLGLELEFDIESEVAFI